MAGAAFTLPLGKELVLPAGAEAGAKGLDCAGTAELEVVEVPCGSTEGLGVDPTGGAPNGGRTAGGAPGGGATPQGDGTAVSPNKLDTSPPALGLKGSPFPHG